MTSRSANAEKKTAYAIGYGKPPKATRFKPGQSGNPKGRKKGAKSLQGVMRAALAEKVSVEIGGRSVRMTKLDALTKRLVASALKGDLGATRLLIGMMQATGMHEDAERALSPDHMRELSVEDATILQRHFGDGPASPVDRPSPPQGLVLPGIPTSIPISTPTPASAKSADRKG